MKSTVIGLEGQFPKRASIGLLLVPGTRKYGPKISVVANRLVATDFPAFAACFSFVFRARPAFVSNDQIQSHLTCAELVGVLVLLAATAI